MFAVIKTGGKQYKVKSGDVLSVEKLGVSEGSKITFDEVVIVGEGEDVKVGTPNIEGAVVSAEVLEQFKDDKVIVFKKKRRHNYRRLKGHRQNLTTIKISEIKTA